LAENFNWRGAEFLENRKHHHTNPTLRQGAAFQDGGTPVLPDTGPKQRDRYAFTRLHAKGGLGIIWLARDCETGREVALKELQPEDAPNPAAWARFIQEAKITAQLQHPGIVPVYDVAQDPKDCQPFYTMRFVAGRTLSEAIHQYHKNQEPEFQQREFRGLLEAFIAVCNAISYAHSRGVVHRDLKGQNVILGDFGEVMVLDWGIAKVMDTKAGADCVSIGTALCHASPPQPSATRAEEAKDASPVMGEQATRRYHASDCNERTLHGTILGTPGYMAPEQAAGSVDRIDPRTDVHGLGAILYEILTGQLPFVGLDAGLLSEDASTEICRRIVHEPPIRPRKLLRHTPPALEAVCLKALAKRPGDRYQSAHELSQEIRRWLDDEAVTVYRDSWTVQAARWLKRHRMGVSGFVGALATLICIAAMTILLAAASERERIAQMRAEAYQRQLEKVQAQLSTLTSR
jgi:serine/threonine-protein kinase